MQLELEARSHQALTEPVRISFLLEALNDMKVVCGNIGKGPSQPNNNMRFTNWNELSVAENKRGKVGTTRHLHLLLLKWFEFS